MSKHILFVLVFTSVISACGADEPAATSSSSQSIDGPYCWDIFGDPIYADYGYDDFLVTLDDCYYYEDPGTGGGGGDTSCASPATYYGAGDGYADDQATAAQSADQNARNQAEGRCLNSALICTPHAGNTTSHADGCSYTDTPGYYHYHCTADASTTCTYTWW